MQEPLLKVSHLKKVFSDRKSEFTAVDDVGFELMSGECLGIVGESGSGKSTVAKMITHLTEITYGEMWLAGENITKADRKKLREIYRNIQMVFQMPTESFDPRRTLGDGIAESLVNTGMNRKAALERSGELLELCGLDRTFAEKYPHEVSGGQCQRAAIARALAPDPKILICDEATSALDVTVQRQVMNLLMKLKTEQNRAFLFICHDLALVQAFCDKVIVMKDGKVVESGTADEIINHPKTEYTRILVDSVL